MELPSDIEKDLDCIWPQSGENEEFAEWVEPFARLLGWLFPDGPNEQCQALCEYMGLTPPNLNYWVNIYELDRNYGGPEEGGWWFNSGKLEKSIPCGKDREVAELVRDTFRKVFTSEANPPLTSMIYNGGAYDVVIETHEGRNWPEERPHYE